MRPPRAARGELPTPASFAGPSPAASTSGRLRLLVSTKQVDPGASRAAAIGRVQRSSGAPSRLRRRARPGIRSDHRRERAGAGPSFDASRGSPVGPLPLEGDRRVDHAVVPFVGERQRTLLPAPTPARLTPGGVRADGSLDHPPAPAAGSRSPGCGSAAGSHRTDQRQGAGHDQQVVDPAGEAGLDGPARSCPRRAGGTAAKAAAGLALADGVDDLVGVDPSAEVPPTEAGRGRGVATS